jgi:YesN/AraC family two-component response regulator
MSADTVTPKETRMSHTVLFVDDEQQVLDSIKRNLFREKDYFVETANGGSSGLAKVKRFMPSVIVTDMRMPDMDGVAFLQQAQLIQPDAIYMVLSGHSDIDSVMTTINDCHVWRYIGKPWQKEELRIALANALEMYEHREERKVLLEGLQVKSRQLEELNHILEDKVRERSQQLQDRNDILHMLVEDAPTQLVCEKICKTIARQLQLSPVHISVPFLDKYFSDTNTPLSDALTRVRQQALATQREYVDDEGMALPLIKNGIVLGVVLIDNPRSTSPFLLAELANTHLGAATLCLMHARNLLDVPAFDAKIDQFIKDL